MVEGPGITTVPNVLAGPVLQRMEHLARVTDTAVYIVGDSHHTIASSRDLQMAIIDAMEIYEWYGYNFEQLLLHQCQIRPYHRHYLVLILTPALRPAVISILRALISTHQNTHGRFETFLFARLPQKVANL